MTIQPNFSQRNMVMMDAINTGKSPATVARENGISVSRLYQIMVRAERRIFQNKPDELAAFDEFKKLCGKHWLCRRGLNLLKAPNAKVIFLALTGTPSVDLVALKLRLAEDDL